MNEPIQLGPCTLCHADCLESLKAMPENSVHCCVTSPPYWGLRDYGVAGQIGLERTPEEYVAKMVEVFREVRRVLRDDGTLWLNLGDSYANDGKWGGETSGKQHYLGEANRMRVGREKRVTGLKPKDLVGIPWRVAFALQADGWWLRQDIIWHKPNPMPESVTDRCTKAHEYIFLMSKSARYFYDNEAIREPHEEPWRGNGQAEAPSPKVKDYDESNTLASYSMKWGKREYNPAGRNKRSVWTVPSAPYSEAHFATFPPDLIKPCILAGTSARGCCPKCGAPWERVTENSPMNIHRSTRSPYDHHSTRSSGTMVEPAKSVTTGWKPTCECGEPDTIPCTVLDPFFGSGTVGQVSLEFGRKCIGIELNPKYVELAKNRCDVTPGLPL